ncbi:pickpocket protein 28-like [Uranotaenia lowii]|uniref:pickpocket protein 28-like n=1 Tax=Uranotaenia lowii TaxID=190385 RepID=UPI00247A6B8A|nr:pickpocket protein 28-like [Uranotaenia lowii]
MNYQQNSRWFQIYGRDFAFAVRKSASPKPHRKLARTTTVVHEIPVEVRKINQQNRVHKGLQDLMAEFCAHSSIHGIGYMGSRQRSAFEKFFWLFVFLLSMFGCGKLIDNSLRKWNENPVIITFDEVPTAVWNIPFPAVTICPEAKIKKFNLNFTDAFMKLTHWNRSKDLNDVEMDNLLTNLQLCDEYFHTSYYNRYYINHTLKGHLVDTLKNISFMSNDTIYYCRLNSLVCKKMFSNTITEEGICMTFNGLSNEEMFRQQNLHSDYEYLEEKRQSTSWNLENGYSAEADLDSYPIRVFGAGFGAGLYVHLMTVNKDLEYHCRDGQGFKVLLHAPSEYPQVSKKFVRVTLGRDIAIAIKPQILNTDNELHDYEPERRQCYFNRERQLKFFQVYTQANCELECSTNYTLKECGCVRYSMPRSADTRVCETSELMCTLNAQINLLELNAEHHLKHGDSMQDGCNCLPACYAIQYDAEITQTIFNFKETLRLRLGPKGIPYEDTITQKQISKLEIYFKDIQFITSKRTELYGLTDFVANCGGILGLCMGVSLLSLVELLYYCTLRPLMLFRQTLQNGFYVVDVNGRRDGLQGHNSK